MVSIVSGRCSWFEVFSCFLEDLTIMMPETSYCLLCLALCGPFNALFPTTKSLDPISVCNNFVKKMSVPC